MLTGRVTPPTSPRSRDGIGAIVGGAVVAGFGPTMHVARWVGVDSGLVVATVVIAAVVAVVVGVPARRSAVRAVVIVATGVGATWCASTGEPPAWRDVAVGVWVTGGLLLAMWVVLDRPPWSALGEVGRGALPAMALPVGVAATLGWRHEDATAAAIAVLAALVVGVVRGIRRSGAPWRSSVGLAIAAVPIAVVVRNNAVVLVMVIALLASSALPPGPRPAPTSPIVLRRPWLAWLVGVVVFWTVQVVDAQGSVVTALRTTAGRWDATIYRSIARYGYDLTIDGGNLPGWFPGYPLLVRVANLVIQDWIVATVVTALLGGLATVVLFRRWMSDRSVDAPARSVALLLLLVYPYAFFLSGVPYSDAVFIALVVGAFLAVERDRLLLAGVLGAVASATRFTGVVAVVAMVVLVLERHGALVPPARGLFARWRVPTTFVRAAVDRRSAWLLLGFGGAIAYLSYCRVGLGDAGAYFRVNAATTDRSPLTSPDTWFKWNVLGGNALSDQWDDLRTQPIEYVGTYAHMALALVVLALVPRIGRRFGWGYAVQCLGVLLLIWTGLPRFGAAGRYLLAAFPAFALVGEALSRRTRRTQVLWLAASASLLVAVSVLWALGRPPAGW